ncbi:MAG TPA: PRC-barrel domain-containing protein [Longimicrobium sp.]|nr:PRC-barrel domain-containing protein [Longimicrobium sp.]
MANNDMDRVVPLGQLDDFRVAEGDPDVRGWEVRASDGRKIGEVDELLVDTSAMKVRYLDVDLDADDVVLSGGHDRHVLIPIGYARLERDRDCVTVDGLASSDVARLPAYGQGPLTRDFEASVRESFATRGRGGGGPAGGGTMDTAGLDNPPGTGMAMGMPGGPLADSPVPMRASGSDMDTAGSIEAPSPTKAPARASGPAEGMSSAGGGIGGEGGDRMGAGSQGPAGGVERERMRGDASHQSAGLAGSDYQHNADEDFYASDAFDDTRFYGARRGETGSFDEAGGMHGSPNEAARGNLGMSAGTGGVDEVDQLSGSGLPRDGGRGSDGSISGSPAGPGSGTGDDGAGRDETRRLAQDAADRLRQDHENRGVGGTGGT